MNFDLHLEGKTRKVSVVNVCRIKDIRESNSIKEKHVKAVWKI